MSLAATEARDRADIQKAVDTETRNVYTATQNTFLSGGLVIAACAMNAGFYFLEIRVPTPIEFGPLIRDAVTASVGISAIVVTGRYLENSLANRSIATAKLTGATTALLLHSTLSRIRKITQST